MGSSWRNWRQFAFVLATFYSALSYAIPTTSGQADLIFKNGRVWTEENRSYHWSQAISIRNGIISRIGDNKTVEAETGPLTRVIDLKGKVVLPGFNDAGSQLFPILGDDRISSLKALQKKYNELGITTLQGGVIEKDDEIRAINALAQTKQLTVRFGVWGKIDRLQEYINLREKYSKLAPDWLYFGGVFGSIDGHLTDKSAALLDNYLDSETKGDSKLTQEKLEEIILAANKEKVPVILHAAGDHAVSMAVTAMMMVKRKLFNSHVRNRVLAAEVVPPQIYSRMQNLNVVVTAYPTQALSNFDASQLLQKQKLKHMFSWKTFLAHNIPLTIGSETEVIDPIKNFLAITSGPNHLRVEQALNAYTLQASRTMGEEHLKGSLREGKYADLVVLENDPFRQRKKLEKNAAPILFTVVDGKIVYEKNAELSQTP
ncbi:MAG: amidohydrolase family protein [Bacteriovoracia bacterium]